jgi:FAD/FMN-containing dehydrogenase
MSPMFTLFSVTLLVVTTEALVDKTTSNVCAQIKDSLAGMLHYPGTKAYKDETANYWSQAMMDRRPACIVMPTTAEGVSSVVKILSTEPTVKFAVKSGGHSPNPDFASTQDGILLSLANMKGATYDEEKGVAYVKPGGKWKDVIAALVPYKKTVVGGRLDIVGVGGYLTGGGLSFLSAQYGMAADTVTNFETVMAVWNVLPTFPIFVLIFFRTVPSSMSMLRLTKTCWSL